jgi:hypothetical protein
MNNQSDWLNRANYTAEQRRHMCVQLLSEAQYWDLSQYLKMMSDSTKRPWVGLTDEEMMECDMDEDDFVISRSRAKLNVQAKLKEKNT